MTELVVNIPDNKIQFFMQLAKELDFVILDKKKTDKKLSSKQQKWVKDFINSLYEVDQHSKGKIKLKTAQQLLNEL